MGRLTVGSLFTGIGGFDLGFERAGFEIKWQVEIDPFCRAVLEKHWPHVTRYFDVRKLRRPERVDVICGGFPCQPHSSAGRRLAAADERDLWPEFRRIIRIARPRWVVAENVVGILSSDAGRFFGNILRDLAESGYDAEWDCLPASAFGANHQRDRVWLVAYPNDQRQLQPEGRESHERRWSLNGSAPMADANGSRLERRLVLSERPDQFTNAAAGASRQAISKSSWWSSEPDVGRVAHGIPARVDRLRGLGNAIVPQIAQWIAERIKEAEGLKVTS